MTVHVLLVSQQPLPNIIPLLDPGLHARRAVLVVSHGMSERARWMESVLTGYGIRCDTWPIADAWDFESVQMRMMELADRESSAVASKALWLNATGGTKLMSMAAHSVFRSYELPVYYIHPERGALLWLFPEGRPAQALADRLRIEWLLQAHGAQVQGVLQRNVPDRKPLMLAERLVADVERYSSAIGAVNALAAQARPPDFEVEMSHTDAILEELIGLFSEYGVLERCSTTGIRFAGEANRFLANGGWLEMYVFDQCRQLRRIDPRIQDLAWGVKVQRRQRNRWVPNELDVVILRDNRLHVIECKTRRFFGGQHGSVGAEALYRLDTLRDLMGGLHARAMLASFRDLPPHDRARAADLRIEVCAGSQLRRLNESLLNFIRC